MKQAVSAFCPLTWIQGHEGIRSKNETGTDRGGLNKNDTEIHG